MAVLYRGYGSSFCTDSSATKERRLRNEVFYCKNNRSDYKEIVWG